MSPASCWGQHSFTEEERHSDPKPHITSEYPVTPSLLTTSSVLHAEMPSSIASLDTDASDHSYDSDEDYRLAQQEWEESLEQLNQIVTVVLLPFFGKFLGRRWSHWIFARYVRLGIGMSFFFGERVLPPTRSR